MNTIRILMLEDNPLDALVIEKQLTNSGLQTDLTIVKSGKDYIHQLHSHSWDLILCDHQLPDYNSLLALRDKNEKDPDLPFILITGAVPEELAVELVQEGANDYILKDRLQRLPLAIKECLQKHQQASAKRSLEQSLSALTQRFQLAAKASFDIIWDYDVEKNIIYCSDAIEKLIGIPLKEFYKPGYLKSFIHEDDIRALETSMSAAIAGKDHKWRKIFRVKTKDNTIAWMNSNALLMRDKNEKVSRIVGVMQDVTDIRRLQHELMEQERIKQKQIAEMTIEAQEKERQEIGMELHDNINQLLATAKIMIDTARTFPEMHDICLTKSQETIVDAINELRHIAHSMMSPAFEKNSFDQVIRNLVNNITLTTDINIHLHLPPTLELIDKQVKLAFYRIIQEQVSNILKYAYAKNLSISIDKTEHSIQLMIEDDGIGYNPKENHQGIGIRNMESRIRLLNGTMKLISAPGDGCMINIQVPVGNIESRTLGVGR